MMKKKNKSGGGSGSCSKSFSKSKILPLLLLLLLVLIGISFTDCRSKKNVKTPMGWLSHKKLDKFHSKDKRRAKKDRHLKKTEDVQQWYRDWIKGDKNK